MNSPRVPKTLFQEGRRREGERKRKAERKEGKKENKKKKERKEEKQKEGRAGGMEAGRKRKEEKGKILRCSVVLYRLFTRVSRDAKYANV